MEHNQDYMKTKNTVRPRSIFKSGQTIFVIFVTFIS